MCVLPDLRFLNEKKGFQNEKWKLKLEMKREGLTKWFGIVIIIMFVMRISEERVLLINVRMTGESETGFWRRGIENIGDTRLEFNRGKYIIFK